MFLDQQMNHTEVKLLFLFSADFNEHFLCLSLWYVLTREGRSMGIEYFHKVACDPKKILSF